jgi:hypothetical protein
MAIACPVGQAAFPLDRPCWLSLFDDFMSGSDHLKTIGNSKLAWHQSPCDTNTFSIMTSL